MGYSLLGAHVNSTVGGLPENILAWKPPLVVILDHSSVWHDVKAGTPKTAFVGRFIQNQSDDPNFDDPNVDPIQEARWYCDKVLPWAERMGSTYSYWQGVNEPIILTPEAMTRFAAFEAERARIMDQSGFQVVVGSFSVGNPRFALWNQFLPALEAALQFNGTLALHEYAWPTLQNEWPWYLLRHRKVYNGDPERGWGGFPAHLRDLPLLVTECGLDGLIEQSDPPRGWRVLYGEEPEQYLSQLQWYDSELLKDKYLAGAALYCEATPDPQWKSYDIWPDLSHELARHATPIYRLLDPEPPDPPIPPGPKPTYWTMDVEYREGARIIVGSFPTAGILLKVTDPWGNETTVVGGSKPEYGEGGFEVQLSHPGIHKLEFCTETFEVEVYDGTAIVTFRQEKYQPPDEDMMLDEAIARLDRMIALMEEYFAGRE